MLRCVHGIFLLSLSATGKPVRVWEWVSVVSFLVWDLYHKTCFFHTMCVSEENRRVSRLCEVQDSSSCVNVCGLSLPPASLTPLLRALKLQASLTELRISANRLNNDLLPELMSAAATMPRLRILDISANQITGEGLKKHRTRLKRRVKLLSRQVHFHSSSNIRSSIGTDVRSFHISYWP